MNNETLLKYDNPAEDSGWACPVGNGRIGGMIFGRPKNEVITLNEDSVWSGNIRHRINPDAQEGFKEVRELIKSGDIPAAEKTAFEKMQGVTPDMRRYMPLGNLYIDMDFNGKAREYSRCLDISDAVSETSFSVNGVVYTRKVFVSAPDDVMVIHITSSEPEMITLSCHIDGRDDYYDDNRPYAENMILYTGGMGIMFAGVLGAKAIGGTIRTLGNKISVRNADEVMIVFSVKTSFYSKNYIESAEIDAEMALQCEYDELFYRHVNDYKELFERVELSLNDNSGDDDISALTTDRRIARLRGNELDNKECQRLIHDNKLIELYFNYSRYLMIAGSRAGSQPMTIQGIWNDNMNAPLGSRYSVNFSTQMNYWIAESCNLSECHIPLFDLLERVCKNGRITAKEMYGIEKGFVCHHNTDIWGDTAPQDMFLPSTIWISGGAWLALHIFEHYEYTLDKEFLAEKYHIMKEAAEFFVSYLIENEDGKLVTCPSVSPENTYLTADGMKGCLCMGASMDTQIITVLFRNVIKSAEILGKDKTFAKKLTGLLEKLPPIEIGKYGQIKEWAVDYDEVEVGHRHISQLFALYPADLISPHKTPKLADAARATLIRRLIHGGGHTGWSCAWIANMWARLYDSRMVYENIKNLLAYSTSPNMLNKSPNFRIDGNFGGTSAIIQALMQSVDGEIILLPALPDEWENGHVCGLRAKGGFTIDIEWENGKLKSARITSDYDGECRLRTGCVVSIVCDGETVGSRIEDGVIVFKTVNGYTYTVRT
ncbi:MAG: glycoside hydrolase family 95 protein [Prevotella sp.]|nr:glycoside hydrolase family 95 protein [Alistipes senegalensis]MCM1357362.1 glycoside hydrolase family 95 protein [Prevotella sp.]